ncbi:MAG: AraC family transcriptional regulator [Pseudomonadota bacterium]
MRALSGRGGRALSGERAAVSGMPADGFARAFRTSLGVAPYRCVQERRIRHAEALLAGSALSISAIALDSGFSSQSHLNKAFKRLTGSTPNSLRQLVRNSDGEGTNLPAMVKDSRSGGSHSAGDAPAHGPPPPTADRDLVSMHWIT